MKTHRFRVLIELDSVSKSWVTYVPSLDNISTFGDSREEAIENTRELIAGYLEAAAKEGVAIVPHELESIDLEVAVA